MPFPRGIDITLFGSDVLATDYDMGNAGMTFTIEGDDFEASYVGTVDVLNKVHKARITASHPIRLTSSKEYTIRATVSNFIR